MKPICSETGLSEEIVEKMDNELFNYYICTRDGDFEKEYASHIFYMASIKFAKSYGLETAHKYLHWQIDAALSDWDEDIALARKGLVEGETK